MSSPSQAIPGTMKPKPNHTQKLGQAGKLPPLSLCGTCRQGDRLCQSDRQGGRWRWALRLGAGEELGPPRQRGEVAAGVPPRRLRPVSGPGKPHPACPLRNQLGGCADPGPQPEGWGGRARCSLQPSREAEEPPLGSGASKPRSFNARVRPRSPKFIQRLSRRLSPQM